MIGKLRELAEYLSKDNKKLLRIWGIFITVFISLCSLCVGMIIEKVARSDSILFSSIGNLLLLTGLTSSLAAGSLRLRIKDTLRSMKDSKIIEARKKLELIVGRDVSDLEQHEIFRALAETGSENAVDGIYAPLFWMTIGAIVWNSFPYLPGPLCFTWIFKSISTIDSMIGYKTGQLKWLGTAGAKADDILTWLPCRIVILTLPIVSSNIKNYYQIVLNTLRDGRFDESPNSGYSEAAFAYCANVQMGGQNKYGNKIVNKPILGKKLSIASNKSVKEILNLSLRLQILWTFTIGIIGILI